jgi:hypothetical protein
MARRIEFVIGSDRFSGELNDTPAAQAIWEALPLDCSYATWGDEIYFDTGVPIQPGAGDTVRETVDLGDIGYWPPGSALCLFYGPTPASRPGEIRPASAVAVLGRILGDPRTLKQARGRRIRVARAGATEG